LVRDELRITIIRLQSGINLEIWDRFELLYYNDLNDLVQFCLRIKQQLEKGLPIRRTILPPLTLRKITRRRFISPNLQICMKGHKKGIEKKKNTNKNIKIESPLKKLEQKLSIASYVLVGGTML